MNTTGSKIELFRHSDSPPGDYDRAPAYERMIRETDVAVPMRDGVKLAVDVYRPDTSEKLPALLAFAIYNKDIQQAY
jgi:predicted acyl esterase